MRRGADETTPTVKTATAWRYVSEVVDARPGDAALAEGLLYPPLVEAVERATPDELSGSLTAVLRNVSTLSPLRGDAAWRCHEDAYTQLRVARICRSARAHNQTVG